MENLLGKRYSSVDGLKGTFNRDAGAGWFRNFLVIVQFTASIVIIIGTLVIYMQLDSCSPEMMDLVKNRS